MTELCGLNEASQRLVSWLSNVCTVVPYEHREDAQSSTDSSRHDTHYMFGGEVTRSLCSITKSITQAHICSFSFVSRLCLRNQMYFPQQTASPEISQATAFKMLFYQKRLLL